jgi:UDP-N-acetylmuramoyl-tripeptide--D-alanyl-D-alanine ligase
MITLRQLHAWLSGSKLIGNPDAVIARIHTDTRSIQAGDLFVALSGEQFDGNSFAQEAIAKGAVAVIAQHGLEKNGIQGLEVADTKIALGKIAENWRTQFDLPLIAVTGSNGKTTVTQMIACILNAHQGHASLATIGNLNNDIGVPLTLLRLNENHKIAVVELGMNHPGEIAYLANMVKPSVVLVNNAQREHLEFMVSVKAVAYENGSAITSLPVSGVAVYPADDEYSEVWKELAAKRKTLTFSLNRATTDVDISCVKADWINGKWQVLADTPAGQISYSLNIAGRHNVKNSLAAISCALAAQIPLATIVAGLQAFSPVKGRSFTHAICVDEREITLIDDTYNSNPDSMRVAIDSLSEMAGPHLIVMGDMGEVGTQGLAFHAEAGEYAMEKGIQQLFAFGALSLEAAQNCQGARHFETIESLNEAVSKELKRVSSVLVKGSRFMKMERVSKHILSLDNKDKRNDNKNKDKNKNNKETSHVA